MNEEETVDAGTAVGELQVEPVIETKPRAEREEMPPIRRRTAKVSIIGSGMVGASLAYSLVVERAANEVVLLDIDKDRARGEARDIQHALPFSAPTKVIDGDYDAVGESDVIVITAGVPQKPGESRLVLIQRNYQIYRDILKKLENVPGDPVLLIVSNPVDILTYVSIKFSGRPPEKIIGSGTILDTARFRYEISAMCGLDPRNVHAYILGEHGDSEVPLWSAANVAGVPFLKFCELCGRKCAPSRLDEIFERVKNAAYDIIRLKGSTYYAIALGATRMIEAILRDQNTVMTASTLIEGQYGIDDICLSIPVVINRRGVGMKLEVPVSENERKALHHSASVLRRVLDQLEV